MSIQDRQGNYQKYNSDGSTPVMVVGSLAKQYPSIYPPIDYILTIDHADNTKEFLTYDKASDTLYARDLISSNKLYRSTDKGNTWVLAHTFTGYDFIYNALVLQTGTVLVIIQPSLTTRTCIMRSADDCTTFTETLDLVYRINALSFGWNEHPTNGVFFGEYPIEDPTYNGESIHIWRSVDDGQTFVAVQTWPYCYPGPYTEGSIRHVHACIYDKYDDKMWFCTGDLDEQCAIYTSDDGVVLTTIGSGGQPWRGVTLIPEQGYMYVPSDSSIVPVPVYRISRFKDYSTALNAEISGYMCALSLYTVQLPNGDIIAFTGQHQRNVDGYLHAYVVKYQQVKEIARLKSIKLPESQAQNVKAPFASSDGQYIYAQVVHAEPFTDNDGGQGFVRFKVTQIRPVDFSGEVE